MEGRKTFQNVLEEVDDLVRTCNSNSICSSHSEHSKVKVKKKYKSEGSTGTGAGTGGMSMTPPAVRAPAPAVLTFTAAVHLRAEEDPLGLLCSHLVCPSLSHASVTRSTG